MTEDGVDILDRDAWVAARKSGLGGSDSHHVLNATPDGCARLLAYDKLGTPPDYPDPDPEEDARGLGTELESYVARRYTKKTGRKLERVGRMTHATHPFLFVHLDRKIVGDPDGRVEQDGPGVLEIKTMRGDLYRRLARDGLKASHVLQVAHAMAVTGYQWASFAALDRDTGKLCAFDVERDDGLIAELVTAEERFWAQHVASRVLPPPLPEIDHRCRRCLWARTCRGGDLYGAKPSREEAATPLETYDSPALESAIGDYLIAKAELDVADETYEAAKASVIAALEGRQAVQASGVRVFHRPVGRTSYDTRGLDLLPPLLKVPDPAQGAARLAELDIPVEVLTVREQFKHHNPTGGGTPLRVYLDNT